MRPPALSLLLLSCLVFSLPGCVPGLTPNHPVETSVAPPQTVSGRITEVESNKMSLRVDDGRQLILELEGSGHAEADVEVLMQSLTPVVVTYEAVGGHLYVRSIEPESSPAPSPTA